MTQRQKMSWFKKSKKPNKDFNQRMAHQQNHRVNSYYTSTKKQINTFERASEVGQKRRHTILENLKVYTLRFGVIVIGFIAVSALFTLSGKASITLEDGGPFRSSGEYEKIVAEALGSSPLNYIKFSLKTDSSAEKIKSNLPESYNVAVYAPMFGRNAEVIISTAPAFAVIYQPDGSSLIVNNRGKVVIRANESVVDTSNLSTIKNESGQLYEEGDQIFKPEEMASILELQYQYTQGKGGPVAFILPVVPREIYTKEGSYIAKFSMGNDVSVIQQYGALRAVQEQLRESNKIPTEYIDVRLGNKVFIK
jgi:hypothetical protein